jgi:hypothetical protein
VTTVSEDRATAVRRLVDGYRVSQAISAAVALGIPDELTAGSRTSGELAAATDAHEPSLYRLLRALASVGVLHEAEGRRFELTDLGEALRDDAPDTVAPWAALVGRPFEWQAWAALADSVRTGENAFRGTHGTDPWTHRAGRPEESAIFDRAMATRIRQWSAAILAAYDFGRFRQIVDVGGGSGALLAAILSAHPSVEGVLVDQEHVVSAASSLLEEQRVADRCSVVAGDFFEAVPDGGDAYVLSAILHDWDDADAARILATIRRAIPAAGTLLLVERVVGAPNEDPSTKFMDLQMLVILGGRERTQEEFAELLASSGFRMTGATRAGPIFVIEAVPA